MLPVDDEPFERAFLKGVVGMATSQCGYGRLLVGVDDAPPSPMQLGNPEGGDFRGDEVDLLNEIGRRLDLEIAYRRSLWSVIVGELVHGALDAVCSAASVTPERQSEVDFCAPHFHLSLAIVKRNGIRTLGALAGARMGVRRGTIAEAYVREHGNGSSAKLSESNDELYAALLNGDLGAVIDDSPIARYVVRSNPELHFAGTLPGTESAYAIMVQKGNDRLRAYINGVVGALDEDGTLARFRGRWLGDPSSPHDHARRVDRSDR